MSELQLALLAIGIGAIVVVYVFGWWQQRRYQSRFGKTFSASMPREDALYRERVAHVVTELDIAETTAPQVAPLIPEETEIEAAEPLPEFPPETLEADTVAPEIPPVETVVLPTVKDETCALLDGTSDFVIELRLAEPSPAGVLDGLWQRKFDFGKPVQVCGLTLAVKQWERAIAESQTLYEQLRIALQLVDRGGAISQARLGGFRDLLAGIARQIKADATIPDVAEIHRRAVELDSFCAEVDQMVGVNLVPPGDRQLTGNAIAQTASAFGMTLEADGAFHALDAQRHTLFTLINKDSRPFQYHTLEAARSKGLTLLLDVPRVSQPLAQFEHMLETARAFARELQLNVVDDRGVAFEDSSLAPIRTQISEVESRMVAKGIVPGSANARRLFS
jgi:FtsZ-interacting cell division protein ZipA